MTDLPDTIAKIRELLPKVTPGPWKRFVPDRGYCIDYIVTEAPEAKNDERHSDIVAETTNSTGPRYESFFEKDSEWIALLNPTTVTALLDRISALEKALEPFAEAAASYDPPEGDDGDIAWSHDFTIGSLRRARAAIADKGGGTDD